MAAMGALDHARLIRAAGQRGVTDGIASAFKIFGRDRPAPPLVRRDIGSLRQDISAIRRDGERLFRDSK
jgi:hypothetical protein